MEILNMYCIEIIHNWNQIKDINQIKNAYFIYSKLKNFQSGLCAAFHRNLPVSYNELKRFHDLSFSCVLASFESKYIEQKSTTTFESKIAMA